MSRANSVIQVGFLSFKRILDAVFQTAFICRLQDWRGSMISLLNLKGGVAQLRDVECMVPNVQQR
eukprot:scaffold264435_cov26-Tisochrysis_lutea.AAC.1